MPVHGNGFSGTIDVWGEECVHDGQPKRCGTIDCPCPGQCPASEGSPEFSDFAYGYAIIEKRNPVRSVAVYRVFVRKAGPWPHPGDEAVGEKLLAVKFSWPEAKEELDRWAESAPLDIGKGEIPFSCGHCPEDKKECRGKCFTPSGNFRARFERSRFGKAEKSDPNWYPSAVEAAFDPVANEYVLPCPECKGNHLRASGNFDYTHIPGQLRCSKCGAESIVWKTPTKPDIFLFGVRPIPRNPERQFWKVEIQQHGIAEIHVTVVEGGNRTQATRAALEQIYGVGADICAANETRERIPEGGECRLWVKRTADAPVLTVYAKATPFPPETVEPAPDNLEMEWAYRTIDRIDKGWSGWGDGEVYVPCPKCGKSKAIRVDEGRPFPMRDECPHCEADVIVRDGEDGKWQTGYLRYKGGDNAPTP